MPLPPFEPNGDLPEGLHQAYVTEFFTRLGSGTPQRERVAARLGQAFDLVRPLQIISRVIVWGSFVTSKPDPADADILWVTLSTFDRSHLPVHVASSLTRSWRNAYTASIPYRSQRDRPILPRCSMVLL
jgi:hypothetical protein